MANELGVSQRRTSTRHLSFGFSCFHTHTHLCNNVKVHNETNELYITGMKIRKTIHTEGIYKEVKSKPLTIAKNILRKELTTSKIRQYIVKKVAEVTINKEVLQSEQVVELAWNSLNPLLYYNIL